MEIKALLQWLFQRSKPTYPAGRFGREEQIRQRIDKSLDCPEFKVAYLGLPTREITRVLGESVARDVWADLETMPARLPGTLVDEALPQAGDPNATEAIVPI